MTIFFILAEYNGRLRGNVSPVWLRLSILSRLPVGCLLGPTEQLLRDKDGRVQAVSHVSAALLATYGGHRCLAGQHFKFMLTYANNLEWNEKKVY